MRLVVNLWGRGQRDPVLIVQEALADRASLDLGEFVGALDAIVREERWLNKGEFATFGDFAVAPVPAGLGVDADRPVKMLRSALLDGGHFAEWVSVLKVITRPPGRPKTLANSEGFRPFYSVATSGTSLDRTLLNLVRCPEHFASVVDRSCTPAQAAANAGLRKPAVRNALVCDFGAVADLPEPAQGLLLRRLFSAVSRDAQCALITELEPFLGPGLSEQWRTSR